MRGDALNLLLAYCLTFHALTATLVEGYCSVSTVSGMNVANCNNRSLHAVPKTLRDDLKVFQISHNFLTEVSNNSFKMYPILKEISLSNNRITSVSSAAFNGVLQLKVLSLANNRLAEVPAGSFRHLQSLAVLSLRSNPIRAIAPHSFEHLFKLIELDLENCSISSISAKAFVGLAKLAELHLTGNKLSSLTQPSLEPILSRLALLKLHDNPWSCDCHLRWLRTWLETSSVVWEDPEYSPVCHNGTLRILKMSWKEVGPSMFVCPIKVISVGKTIIEARHGEEVTFECLVHSDPEPQVTWLKDDQPLPPDIFKVTMNHLWTASTHERHLLSTLTVANATAAAAGQFSCVAENDVSRVELSFHLLYPSRKLVSSILPRNRISKSKDETEDSTRQKMTIGILTGLSGFVALCLVAVCALLSRRRRWTHNYKVTDSEADISSKSTVGGHSNPLVSQMTSPIKPPAYKPPNHYNKSSKANCVSPAKEGIFDSSVTPVKNISCGSSKAVNQGVPYYSVLALTRADHPQPVSSVLVKSISPSATASQLVNNYQTFGE